MNKSQITIKKTGFAYRYDKKSGKTFEVKYRSSDTTKGYNIINISIDEFGWEKSLLAASILGFIAILIREKKLQVVDSMMEEFKDTLLSKEKGSFSEIIDEFLRFPMLSAKSQEDIIEFYSKKEIK